MNTPIGNPLFDEHDLLIRRALDETAVPQSARNRARESLAVATMMNSAAPITVEPATTVDCATLLAAGNDLAGKSQSCPQALNRPYTSLESETTAERQPACITDKPIAANFSSGLARGGNWLSIHRRLAGSLALAASLLLLIGVYFMANPLDHLQLVAICTKVLDERLDTPSHWEPAQPDGQWLRAVSHSQSPRFIAQVPLPNPPLGGSGQLWKLTYDGRADLYVLEIRGAELIEGLGQQVVRLQQTSTSWSVAASQDNQLLLVFMTKGSLEHYLRFGSLA